MCEWLNKTPIYKFDKFYFFNLSEKFVKKKEIKKSFLTRKDFRP